MTDVQEAKALPAKIIVLREITDYKFKVLCYFSVQCNYHYYYCRNYHYYYCRNYHYYYCGNYHFRTYVRFYSVISQKFI
jgi:hypothetical protein